MPCRTTGASRRSAPSPAGVRSGRPAGVAPSERCAGRLPSPLASAGGCSLMPPPRCRSSAAFAEAQRLLVGSQARSQLTSGARRAGQVARDMQREHLQPLVLKLGDLVIPVRAEFSTKNLVVQIEDRIQA